MGESFVKWSTILWFGVANGVVMVLGIDEVQRRWEAVSVLLENDSFDVKLTVTECSLCVSEMQSCFSISEWLAYLWELSGESIYEKWVRFRGEPSPGPSFSQLLGWDTAGDSVGKGNGGGQFSGSIISLSGIPLIIGAWTIPFFLQVTILQWLQSHRKMIKTRIVAMQKVATKTNGWSFGFFRGFLYDFVLVRFFTCLQETMHLYCFWQF